MPPILTRALGNMFSNMTKSGMANRTATEIAIVPKRRCEPRYFPFPMHCLRNKMPRVAGPSPQSRRLYHLTNLNTILSLVRPSAMPALLAKVESAALIESVARSQVPHVVHLRVHTHPVNKRCLAKLTVEEFSIGDAGFYTKLGEGVDSTDRGALARRIEDGDKEEMRRLWPDMELEDGDIVLLLAGANSGNWEGLLRAETQNLTGGAAHPATRDIGGFAGMMVSERPPPSREMRPGR
jgi:hypothetical protein